MGDLFCQERERIGRRKRIKYIDIYSPIEKGTTVLIILFLFYLKISEPSRWMKRKLLPPLGYLELI